MVIFYFIRHGSTEATIKGLMCGGGWDIPLTNIGINQAKNAAIRISNTVNFLNAIYSSPQIRAVETAKIIASEYDIMDTRILILMLFRPFYIV